MNFSKSRKGFLSAGKFLRKSTASAQISSFRAIRPFGTFWRKSGNFSEAAAKEIFAPGMRGAERFRENFGAAGVLLTDEEAAEAMSSVSRATQESPAEALSVHRGLTYDRVMQLLEGL